MQTKTKGNTPTIKETTATTTNGGNHRNGLRINDVWSYEYQQCYKT